MLYYNASCCILSHFKFILGLNILVLGGKIAHLFALRSEDVLLLKEILDTLSDKLFFTRSQTEIFPPFPIRALELRTYLRIQYARLICNLPRLLWGKNEWFTG